MDLDSLIIHVFCSIDEALRAVLDGRRLRQRGPAPTLDDAEALTIEVVGAFLGFHEDKALFDYFRRSYGHFFPALRMIHRTTFTRQVANLWKVKEALWQHLLVERTDAPAYVIDDSVPVPVCRFGRAYRCRRFRGEADYGYDWVAQQRFFGFRLHALVDPMGLIRVCCLTAANTDEKDALDDMTDGKVGRVLGDRNFWSPERMAVWRDRGVEVIAPFKRKSTDPDPRRSARLGRLRRRVETVFGQFTERYDLKQVRARDLWHQASRLLRCVLSHTLAVLINRRMGHSPLRLEALLIS